MKTLSVNLALSGMVAMNLLFATKFAAAEQPWTCALFFGGAIFWVWILVSRGEE